MDFQETQEQTMLRQAIADIAADFGHEYYAERGRRGEKVEELWEALARHCRVHHHEVRNRWPEARVASRLGFR